MAVWTYISLRVINDFYFFFSGNHHAVGETIKILFKSFLLLLVMLSNPFIGAWKSLTQYPFSP